MFNFVLSFRHDAADPDCPGAAVLRRLHARGGGVTRLNLEAFTSLPPAAFEEGGGFGNAIVGTLVMVGMAALISVPLGIMAAVFLAEIGPETRLAQVVRFAAKVLSGFPSILAGVFVFSTIVLLMPTLLGLCRRQLPSRC